MAKLKHKKIIGFLLLLVLIGTGFGGKVYMDKRKLEKEYQQGIELIQSYVTDYLVKNYAGIEKIEWQGIGVEYRNSPILGPSLFGNYVDTDVKVYVSDDRCFNVNFTLDDETEYDDNLKKYVKLDSLNPKNTEFSIRSDFENATYDLSSHEKKIFEKFGVAAEGSKNAKVVYNLKIHELKY
ncbi:MAG: hypothetical protein L0I13_02335 [Lactococcus plantarum]|nr:hypothetical protein [Lactococcus plantarum]